MENILKGRKLLILVAAAVLVTSAAIGGVAALQGDPYAQPSEVATPTEEPTPAFTPDPGAVTTATDLLNEGTQASDTGNTDEAQRLLEEAAKAYAEAGDAEGQRRANELLDYAQNNRVEVPAEPIYTPEPIECGATVEGANVSQVDQVDGCSTGGE